MSRPRQAPLEYAFCWCFAATSYASCPPSLPPPDRRRRVPCHHLPSEELRPVSFEGSGRPAEYKHRSPSSPSPVVPEELECPRCSSGAWPRPLLSGGMGSTAASSTRAAASARCLQTSGQTARDRSWAGEPCCFTERDSRFLSVPYHPLHLRGLPLGFRTILKFENF